MFRFAVSLLVLGLSATTWAGASFAESSSMKETAADRMMPREQAQKMRVCRQLAKERSALCRGEVLLASGGFVI